MKSLFDFIGMTEAALEGISAIIQSIKKPFS
ncbi:hypothetical protein MGA3_02950 [Bacillus methanolicus MGA3]|nr:hypothetical protein MGA3_02950 [Bacillus methanolicus MGA3]